MSISAGYLESVRELLAFVPDLEIKKMFGGAVAMSGGASFAIIDDDELWLKADDETRGLFEAEGLAQFTYPMKDGVMMAMAYWRAPADVWDDPDAARQWTMLAIEAALRGKAKKKPKKSKAKT
jgi:DNA transformation protein